MDYEDILREIGEFGTFQRKQLAIVFLPVLFSSFSGPISVFLAGDQNYRCRNRFSVNGSHLNTSLTTNLLQTSVNESKYMKEKYDKGECHTISINGSRIMCDEWDFDTSVFKNTIVSQFDLVCENTLLKSHAISAFFIGSSCSVVIMTCLADMLIAGTVILLVYCAGEFVLVFLAYFIRDWRWLQLAVGAPMIIPLIYWWPKVLPESVRWLISRGRTKEALVILRRAATVNGRNLPTSLHIPKDKTVSNIKIIQQIISSRRLLMYWGIASSNWFVVSFIYYGITLNLDKLGGNIYTSFVYSVLAETVGSSILFFMDKVGHKRLHMIAMSSTCVVCVASIFPLFFAGPSEQWLTLLFAMLGKCSVSTAFGMVYVYTGEIFPTVTRTFAVGSCNFFARVASLCSPYLYDITDGPFKNVLPLILYAVLITVVTLLAALLPETTNKTLPDRIKDTEDINITTSGTAVLSDIPDQDDERTMF